MSTLLGSRSPLDGDSCDNAAQMTAPTLEDDEAALLGYAQALIAAVEETVGGWIRKSVCAFDVELASSAKTDEAVELGSQTLVAELGDLLMSDIDEQTIGPLQILRNGVRFATEVLTEAGVPTVDRDDFAARSFPNDLYSLSPASFADIDASLHEPGLVWGAAKAHVHLRRRRESTGRRVVALSADLIDRSKISAAFPATMMVRSPADLVDAARDASLVLVDLSRIGEVALLAQLSAHVVAYGSHVDDDVLVEARDAGAEALPRSLFFRRLAAGDL